MRSIYFFADDFESTTSGNWTNSVNPGVNHWNLGCGVSGIYRPNAADAQNVLIVDNPSLVKARSGSYTLWADNTRFIPNTTPANFTGESAVAMTKAITLPASGEVRLQFEHNFDFESGGLDGGLIEYSVDGGTTWTNAKESDLDVGLITGGRTYEGVIFGGFGNPLAGKLAFVGTTNATYVSTQLNLGSLAGRSVKFRFHMGSYKWSPNWAGSSMTWPSTPVLKRYCRSPQLSA